MTTQTYTIRLVCSELSFDQTIKTIQVDDTKVNATALNTAMTATLNNMVNEAGRDQWVNMLLYVISLLGAQV